jgi:RND family efflux transporter MFP subunit
MTRNCGADSLAVCLVFSLLLSTACRQSHPVEKPPTPVKAVRVEERTESTGARYSANIEPATRVDVSFKVGGYVTAIHQVSGRNIQEGDYVPAGTVLASVRQSDYTLKVNQAKSQLLRARAGVEASRSQLAQAEAPLEQAKLNWARAQNLFASQSLTKPDYDAAKANYDASVARRESAQAQLSASEADIAGATAALSEAETALGDAALKAPISGTVLQRKIELGSLVGAGTAGFTLADVSSVKADLGVPDVVVLKLHVGQALDVNTEALPGTSFRGRITSISPAADPKTRVFAVQVTIPNPGGKLKTGMIASVEINEPGAGKSELVVPLTAIVQSKEGRERYAVFVVEDQAGTAVARSRTVRLGEAVGGSISVRAGLRAGEHVVSSGAFLLVDGERVQVIQ